MDLALQMLAVELGVGLAEELGPLQVVELALDLAVG